MNSTSPETITPCRMVVEFENNINVIMSDISFKKNATYMYEESIHFMVYNVVPGNDMYALSGRYCGPHSSSIK